ncbi:MAG: 23S rRNA (guanosine(2251)-2'-O)-methyltransferase RlmB [Alphaproteobacteria bacterium]
MAQRKHRRTAFNPSRPAPENRGGGEAYWIYGWHAVNAALANRQRACLRLMAAAPERVEIPPWRADLAIDIAERAEIERHLPADAVHQGVALQVRPLRDVDLDDLFESAGTGPLLVLDQVTDPRNVGAILRSAAAFDAAAVVLARRHAPPESGAMAKAASGALDLVPLVRVANLARGLRDIAQAGYWCLGLDAGADATLAEALPAGRPAALVLGAEGEGLRRLTSEACDDLARLPIGARMPSLNVSAAATLALYIAHAAVTST